ncbi:MAG: transcription termination/antitermination protein NusA, partial [Spirochaetota bacterium]
RLDELPGADEGTTAALASSGIEMIEDFLSRSDEELAAIEGLSAEEVDGLRRIIEENVEVIEENAEDESYEGEEVEAEIYECPECHFEVTPDMTNCPQCGVALSFEYEDEDADGQES